MPWHFYCTEKPVSQVMKTIIDFFKKNPDTAPFPNFVGEKIFNDGGLLAHFWVLGHNFRRPQKFEKSQKTKSNI
jgi:hypothetical protein